MSSKNGVVANHYVQTHAEASPTALQSLDVLVRRKVDRQA